MKKLNKYILSVLMLLFLILFLPTIVPVFPGAYTVQAAVAINVKSKTMVKGTTYTLKITGTSKTITWSSSNKKVATVSSSGKVTAASKGTATITATVGGKKYTCKIIVEAPSISVKSKTMIKGTTYTLKMNNTTRAVTWSSSNKKVATVSASGKVTAIANGTATITATIQGKKYTCKITVETPSINTKSKTMIKGTTYTLKMNNNTQTVKWSSSNKSVATVSSSGKVTAAGKGSVTITATIGSKKYTCKITVEAPFFSSTTLSLNVAANKSFPLNGTTLSVTYKTSNSKIARVDSNGKVYAIKEGTATITATVSSKSYTYTITVNKVTSVSGWKTIYDKKYYYVKGVPTTGIATIEERKYYFDSAGILTSKVGIDVSSHNGTINWEKVKADGIEFAILRCGYGDDYADLSQDDKQFARNVSECTRLGIPFGVYLYSYAMTTEQATSEAEHVLRLMSGVKASLGIWYDVEGGNTKNDELNQTKLSPEELSDIINTFCNKIKAKNYSVGLYSYKNFLESYLEPSILTKYDIWLAHYITGNNTSSFSTTYALWQYTSDGTVNGITGRVDMNIMFSSKMTFENK